MIVLGINAKLDGHDPSAALFIDGAFAGAAEEERFSRIRHAPGAIPTHATGALLARSGITIDDVDVVAHGWDTRQQDDAPEPSDDADLLEMLLPRRTFPTKSKPKLIRVPHHKAHAYVAAGTSGMTECAVLVADGSGEDISCSAWVWSGGRLRILWDLPFESSLGFFYEAASTFAGLGKFGEGKVMGLGAYGDRYRHEFRSVLDEGPVGPSEGSSDTYLQIIRRWIGHFRRTTGLEWNIAQTKWTHLGQEYRQARTDVLKYADFAASVQERFRADYEALAILTIRDSGLQNLAVAGGAALNCLANASIVRDIVPGQFYVPPCPGDSGIALGAAIGACYESGITPTFEPGWVYAGIEEGDADIAAQLRDWGIRYRDACAPEELAAQAISAGKTVAWFNGRAELGPRALGNRSLFASPSSRDVRDRVNRVKGREAWRPLAPTVLEDEASKWFDGQVLSPYMVIAGHVAPGNSAEIQGAIHADGSSRPQIVESSNERLLSLLHAVRRETGVAALLNTSLNVQEPMVNRFFDAYGTFARSNIDVLVAGPFVIERGPRD